MAILIVNQSPAMSIAIQYALEDAGYAENEIFVEHNPFEAFTQILMKDPELVLSDLHMPENEGANLVSRLRAEGMETNFGLLTSEHCAHTINHAMNAGANFVLQKPFNPADLRNKLVPFSGNLVVGDLFDYGNNHVVEDIPTLEHKEEATAESDDLLAAIHEIEAPLETLTLPSKEKIENVLNKSLLTAVSVSHGTNSPLTEKDIPMFLALFGNPSDKLVRGFCIMDINSLAILHSSLAGAGDDMIDFTVSSKILPQQSIPFIKDMVQELAGLFIDPKTKEAHSMLSTKQVTQYNEKLAAVFNGNSGEKTEYVISTQSGKKGRLIVISKD